MAEEPDVIRQQIEQTRESLTQKLETLEGQVKDTVSSVTSAVESTVETVKTKVEDTVQAVTSTVESTVHTVKRTFDIPYQVDRHPWAMAGGSLLLGVAAGFLVGPPRRHRHARARRDWAAGLSDLAPAYEPAAADRSPPPPAPAPRHEAGPGLLSSVLSTFEPEINRLKQAAIGLVLGAARDFLKQAVPASLAGNVEEILDSVTRKVGGEPVRGPVLPPEEESAGPASRPTHFPN